jgi:hypothetical protein
MQNTNGYTTPAYTWMYFVLSLPLLLDMVPVMFRLGFLRSKSQKRGNVFRKATRPSTEALWASFSARWERSETPTHYASHDTGMECGSVVSVDDGIEIAVQI